MKSVLSNFIIVCSLTLTLLSCEKNDVANPTTNYPEITYDSDAVATNSLTGSWRWIKRINRKTGKVDSAVKIADYPRFVYRKYSQFLMIERETTLVHCTYSISKGICPWETDTTYFIYYYVNLPDPKYGGKECTYRLSANYDTLTIYDNNNDRYVNTYLRRKHKEI